MAVESNWKMEVIAVCDWIVGKVELYSASAVILVLLVISVIALGQSATKLLWLDELITLKTASLPHWSDVWSFYNDGLDTTGPLPSMIARIGLMLPISPEVACRLPFTLAYLVMCFCMYRFVHRRYPAGYALAAPIFALNYAFFNYATEARAYALVLAGSGVAMLSWQSAVGGRRRLLSACGLWLGLAFGMAAHAFAIFLLVPFAIAQLGHDLRRKEADVAIWTALVLSPAGLLPALHGELLAKKIYGANFWSQPDLKSLSGAYTDFVLGGSSYLKVIFVALIGAALLRWRQNSRPRNKSPQSIGGFSTPEWILVAALVLLPVVAAVASYPLHVYVARYAIACNIGMVLVSLAIVGTLARRSRYVGATLLLLFLLVSIHNRFGTFVQGLAALGHPDNVHEQLENHFNRLDWVKLLEQSSLPIVTDDISIDSQLDFYAKPELRQRLYAVTDIGDLDKYPKSTTFQLNFICFGGRIQRETEDIAGFLRQHSRFLQTAEPSEFGWLIPYLAAQPVSGRASSVCLGPANCTGRTTVYYVQFLASPASAKSNADLKSMLTY